MAERYMRVFSLDKDLYAEGSPVLIKAGALLLDSKSNKVLAQLKFQNIGSEKIKALTVGVMPLDVAGDPNGKEIEFQYLDMLAGRDNMFGEQTPIPLPDNTTRGFSIYIKNIIYEDNQKEVLPYTVWEMLPPQDTLLTMLNDNYAVKQFQLEYHVDFEHIPLKYKDIWLCGCQTINRAAEAKCHKCGFEYKKILAVNVQNLQQKGKDVREREEQIRREELEKAQILQKEQEEQRRIEAAKKEIAIQKKRRIIYAIIALVLVIGIFSFVKIQYNTARANNIAKAMIGKTFIAQGTEDIINPDYPNSNDDIVGTRDYIKEETFNSDYTVTEIYTDTEKYDSNYLAEATRKYPNSSSTKHVFSHVFDIEVSFWGNVTLTEDTLRYSLKVDSNDLPISYEDDGYVYTLKE